jgi:hypothetical protein
MQVCQDRRGPSLETRQCNSGAVDALCSAAPQQTLEGNAPRDCRRSLSEQREVKRLLDEAMELVP